MKYLKLLLFFISLSLTAQQGGMWIPSLLKGMNENEMKGLGSQLSAEDIYSVNQSSLKDAIVHFNGGCTSEIISDQGLILTNHHCGYGAIQSHSTVDHDYLQNGFWAHEMKDELPNEGMTATLIVRIDDVTESVMKNVASKKTLEEQEAQIDKNIAKVKKKTQKEDWQDLMVKSFFNGNQYLLFVTEVFKDVRMVGAPPSAIGKFGSDTDNWMWPRHTGDFALFRIYADKNNRPATYHKDNVPYSPKHFLPISLDGVEENDFTMVFGFPGTTNEYLPAVAIEQIVEVLNPAKIEIRDHTLKVVDKYMRADQQIKIQYASKYARTANYWKKWIGENQGLTRSNAVTKKQKLEQDFQQKVAGNPTYANLLSEFDKLYQEIETISLARDYWREVANRNIELLASSSRLYRFEQKVSKDPSSFESEVDKLKKYFTRYYKNYNAQVDHDVFTSVMTIYLDKNPKSYTPDALKGVNVTDLGNRIYKNSALIDSNGLNRLLEGDQKQVLSNLNADIGYQIGKALATSYYNEIDPQYKALKLQIDAVQKVYMKALTEVFPEERIFPDANRTLRVTYGKVKGYYPRDAVYYQPVSYLDGVIEKYQPGDYEFDLPKKLLELHEKKDYGPYAYNGKIPVNFIGTNHTTGGNSGSPVLDAHGNLIGLNFDRVWEGTMSDYNYDPAICRNIMVDARYILFIIDKYANCQRLIDEMKLVHPKKG